MGLGEGDSLKAWDDSCTLSTSFWKRVLCLFSLWDKTGDMELMCDLMVCFRVGDLHELRAGFGTEESKLLDELPMCFGYGSLESSDDF